MATIKKAHFRIEGEQFLDARTIQPTARLHNTLCVTNQTKIMKDKNVLPILALLTLLGSSLNSAAQSTAFTYQGRLDREGSPANGSYDLQFALYDALANGNQVGAALNKDDVSVTDGLFTVTLDFGAEAFTGASRWLEIRVRPGDSAGDYTVLSPRQELTPAPYALYAANFTGAVLDGQLSSLIPRLNANQTFTGVATFSPALGPPFLVGNSSKVNNLNADLLDGLDSSAFLLKAEHCLRTIAELKAQTAGFVPCVTVLGYYAPGDGGGGNFYWDAEATALDNGGTVLLPDSNPALGRWKRLVEGSLSVKWFGAKGNGQTDDTLAIQSAIDATPGTGGTVFFPRGVYRTLGVLRIRNRSNIKLAGVPVRLDSVADLFGSCIKNEGVGYTLELVSDDGGAPHVGAFIDGLHLRGNGSDHVLRIANFGKVHIQNSLIYYATAENKAGISFYRVNYVSLANTRIEACYYGMRSENGPDDYLNNLNAFQCEFSAHSKAGVELQGAQLGFYGCTFEGSEIGAMISTILGGNQSIGIVFSGCYFEANSIQALRLGGAANVHGASLLGNYFILQTPSSERYLSVSGSGVVIQGNGFYGLAGTNATHQLRLDNARNVRIGPNLGLDLSKIEQLGTTANVSFEGDGTNVLSGVSVLANGRFAENGDAQTAVYVLRGITTDATPTELFLDGIMFRDGIRQRMSIPLNGAWTFDILVVARSSGASVGGYQIKGVIQHNALGLTTFIGIPSVTTLGEQVPGWDVAVEADDGNDALAIKVTGSATTVRWVATVRTVEVIF